jgi:hypothetical protein
MMTIVLGRPVSNLRGSLKASRMTTVFIARKKLTSSAPQLAQYDPIWPQA